LAPAEFVTARFPENLAVHVVVQYSWKTRVTASILQQVAANNQAAMDECLTRYGGLVWNLVLRRCVNRADAEDVVQEVFLDVWKSAHRYDPSVAKESTFIAMVTRRRLIDRIRKQQRCVDTAPIDAASEPAANAALTVDANEEVARVRQAMGELKSEERTVIEMAIDRGLSQTEIAEQTQLPLGTVKSHARRGMMRLRSALGVGGTMKGGVR
jgi:RNA polymerase sigma-70 factor (ECF subfamily)